jgi:uncharacterized membrane protein YfhO
MKDKIKDLVIDKYIILLSILTLAIACILYKDFLFGKRMYIYTDIGSDTKNAYWPIYKYVIENIRAGTLDSWSFNMGLGTNIATVTSNVFDPFNIILLILPMRYLEYGLLLGMLTKIYFSGIIFYVYLRKINIEGYAGVIGALIWAFNGYLILWGQHYMFATAVVLFTYLIYGLERIIQDNKSGIFISGVTILAMNSPYLMFAATIYLFIYALFRYLYKEKIYMKQLFFKMIGVFGKYLLGIGLAAFIFLPSCYAILGSPRVLKEEIRFPSLWAGKLSVAATLTRMFSNDLMIADKYIGPSNYYEVTMLSTSILIMLLIPQLFIDIKGKKRKLMIILASIATIFAMFSPVVAFVFNAFSAVATRWSFVIIFTLVVAGAIILNNLLQKKQINLLLLKIQSLGMICIGSYAVLQVLISTEIEVNILQVLHIIQRYMLVIIIIIIIEWIIEYYYRNNVKKCIWLLIGIVCIDIITSNCYAVKRPATVTKEDVEQGQKYYDNTIEAIQELETIDNTFYRVHKDYYSVFLNDPMYQGYKGITSYLLNTPSTIKFSKEFGNTTRNINQINDFKDYSRLKSFLGIKYYLSREECLGNYDKIIQVKDIGIFENKNVFPLGFTYDSYLSYNQIKGLNNYIKEDIMLNTVVLDGETSYIQQGQLPTYEPIGQIENVKFRNMTIKEGEALENIFYVPTNNDPNIFVNFQGAIKDDMIVHIKAKVQKNSNGQIFFDEGKGFSEIQSVKFELLPDSKEYFVAINSQQVNAIRIDIGSVGETVNIDNVSFYKRPSIEEALVKKDEFNITYFSNKKIEGNIEVDSDKIMTWTIPYEKGWKVKVDGEEVSKFTTNIGFIGINLAEGSHNITLEYRMPGSIEGLILSIITLLIIWGMHFKKSI